MYAQVIDPSCISVGDTIRVHHFKQLGLELSLTGTVAIREDLEQVAVFYTEEHGILLCYEYGETKAVTVYLLNREPIKQETLSFFDMDNEELVSRYTD